MEQQFTPENQNEVNNRFTYHPPTPEKTPVYNQLMKQGKEVANTILREVPEGRERSIALTKIEEAVLWAAKGLSKQDS